MSVIIESATVKQTERGSGVVCGWEGCGGKWIMNLKRLQQMWSNGEEPAFRNGVCCPYCGRPNRLPEP